MSSNNVFRLILYKQHYRDDYREDALPKDIYSSFGYYDGFKIEEIHCENNSFIEELCESTCIPVEDISKQCSLKTIGIFSNFLKVGQTNGQKQIKKITGCKPLFCSVGFVQIDENCNISDPNKLRHVVYEIEACSEKNHVMVMGTLDNADFIVLCYAWNLAELNSTIAQIDKLDSVCYMHTITGVAQKYLDDSENKKKLLTKYNGEEIKLASIIDEFSIKIAAKDKENAINALIGIVNEKCKNMYLNKRWYIKNSINNAGRLCIDGHHDIELVFKNTPLEFVLFSMLPKGILSHDNEVFGKEIYNIESGYKYIDNTGINQNNSCCQNENSNYNNQASNESKVIGLIRKIIKYRGNTYKEEDPVIQSLYISLNMLAEFEHFQLANDIFYLVFPAINNFLEQYMEFDCLQKDDDISAMIEYINSVVRHSVHTHEMFLMIPGYCGGSFVLSTKLMLLYQWMAYAVKELLKADSHKYDVLICPETKVKPETREIRYSISEHTIIVKLGQKMLFQPDFSIILVHELAHYIGEKERLRENRTQRCINLTARLMTEMMFDDVGNLVNIYGRGKIDIQNYKEQVCKNIEEYITNKICTLFPQQERYASDLRKILSQETFTIICAEEDDKLFEKIFLSVEDALTLMRSNSCDKVSDREKVIQLYCRVIKKILQNNKIALFSQTMEQVIENLVTVFKEIYSDVCSYVILDFDFNKYQQAFVTSENQNIESKNISPMQSIREYVMNELMKSQIEYDNEQLHLKDTYLQYQMFSYDYVQTSLKEYATQCEIVLRNKLSEPDLVEKVMNEVREAYKALENQNISSIYGNILEKIDEYKKAV